MVTESLKPFMLILLQTYNQASQGSTKPYPYFTDREGHAYGTILEANDLVIKVLFFMVDLPRMVEWMESKNGEAIISWIQTVPLEYVPTLYGLLADKGFSFPFKCPSLPDKKQVMYGEMISTTIVE